jgi:thiol-disulfide isomerase/thioredoxin
MLAITIGPLAFPAAPLVLLLALLAAVFVARRWAGWRGMTAPTGAGAAPAAADADTAAVADAAEHGVWWAALAGLVAARAAHLGLHAEAYAGSPAAWLDLRDGGWHAASGWAVAAAVLGWRLHRARAQPPVRAALLAAAATALLGWGAGQGALWAAAPRPADGPLPALALQRVDGATAGQVRTLPEIVAGRPAVINLWATWCGPCRAEMPMLAQAQARHRDVQFVFVNQGESPAAVQAWLAGAGLTLEQVWLDPGSELGPAVGSRGLPTTLFLDAEGRLVDAHMGMLNAAALRARLQPLQAP